MSESLQEHRTKSNAMQEMHAANMESYQTHTVSSANWSESESAATTTAWTTTTTTRTIFARATDFGSCCGCGCDGRATGFVSGFASGCDDYRCCDSDRRCGCASGDFCARAIDCANASCRDDCRDARARPRGGVLCEFRNR